MASSSLAASSAAAADVARASHASGIAVLSTLAELRAWRKERFARNETVGFVPTMGALHQGHLDLVRTSLRETHSTIVSIYVNPAQFAPSEDLSSYPRTLPSDLAALSSLSSSSEDAPRSVSAVFAPSSAEMYPNGIEQDRAKQRGAFVEVAGLQDHMEGRSRPTFFRGVATVVAKLFNAVQVSVVAF
ncbi:Nucleotidylyl transferase, partial [Tilletiopsis washingtonensis]